MWQERVKNVIIVSFLLVCSGWCFFEFIKDYKERNKLQDSLNSCLINKQELGNEIDTLNNDKKELQNQIEILNNEKANLQKELENLKKN